MERQLNRRSLLRRTVGASVGGTLVLSLEKKALLAQMQKNTEATNPTGLIENTKGVPCGRIGNVKISRLILGGNLIGGAAHSRDLIYTSQLIRNYFTDEKILETWQIAEEAGINTMSA